ncbi:MAG: helix-turn-helix transcriptional regulator [Robiginitomaculum sp.]|nr:helix-turn-helix transcriptional regulator [Robiginitomaculum sp.]
MNNNIRALRAKLRWSQADLAEHVGVSRQAINAVETGKHDPSLQLAFNIAKSFNLTIEGVFDPTAQE